MSLKSLKIKEIDQQYQISKQSIRLSDNEYQSSNGFRYGLWSRYNPLTQITQLGIINQFESNCLLLHSAVEEKTYSLNFLYSDCLDYANKKIKKKIAFIDNNNEEHIFEEKVDIFEYENVWYFFCIFQLPQQQKLELIIIGNKITILHQYLEIKRPFQDTNLLMTFGDSMIVGLSKVPSIQSGTKFTYFPGQLILYEYTVIENLDDINYDQLANETLQPFLSCKCKPNLIYTLNDLDINYLQNQIFVSENINCNSFTLSGWLKITDIIQKQDEFMYQLLILTSNFQNSLADINLSPLSLSYRISSIKNQIIVSTYSYTFPIVTIDFSDNPFLIKKELEIDNPITLWHNIYVKLQEDYLTIEIKFYDENQIYIYKSEIKVIQFKRTQFKLQYGNNLQLASNYLNVQLRNIKFYNCEIQIIQQNCHYSCKDCDGPTKNNCLSCDKTSSRIYLPQFKACVCPINTIDKEYCLSYSDYNLELVIDINMKQKCKYGYFEYLDNCFQCPSIITENLVTCLECVQNPKKWIQDPQCDKTLFLDKNGDVQRIYSDQIPKYFQFDGMDLIYCKDCNQNYSFILNDYMQDISKIKIISYKYFCYSVIPNCEQCIYTIYGNICYQCYYEYVLINGACTQLKNTEVKYCIAPYYLTLNKQCKLCSISFCKYCFEFLLNDQNICTLYGEFQYEDQDEERIVGCALCEENYIYDFDIGKCLFQKPNIQNCLRSYIKDNQEICTLSLIDDFNIASEIVECQKYQPNCLQCILSPESQIKCVICDLGYTASIKNGGCYQTDYFSTASAKIVTEGSFLLKNGWTQLIQSFMMKFQPIQYFSNRFPILDIQEQIVECIDGFQLVEFVCRKFCDSNCQKCDYNYQDGFICDKCPLNYYFQPNRYQFEGSCSQCPNLCQACQIRSEQEIYTQKPNFSIDNYDNHQFTKKCFKQVSDPNIQLDPYDQIARYCFDEFCSSTFLHKIQYDYCELIDSHWEKEIQIQYLNYIGVHTIIIQFNFTSSLPCYFVNQLLKTTLKTKIFSLKKVQFIITSEINLIYQTNAPIIIQNIDNLVIANLIQKRMENDDFLILNYNNSIDLKLVNFTIIDSIIHNTESCFQTSSFGDIQLNNLTILNTRIENSSLLSLEMSKINGIIKIHVLQITNSILINSNLFQFTNNQIFLQVEYIQIENCIFQNSTILFAEPNFDQLNQITFKNITIKQCQFQNSNFISCFGQTILSIININLFTNDIQMSSLINANYNLSIDYFYASDNNLKESQLITILEKNYNSLISIRINNFNIQQFQMQNSNFLKMQSSQESSNVIFKMTKFYLKEIISPSNYGFTPFLFIIKCYQLISKDIQFFNLNNIFIFYIYDSNQIVIQNIIYEQQYQKQKIQLDQICKMNILEKNQLLKIMNFNSFKIQNLLVLNQFTVDESILHLSPKQIELTSVNSTIQIMDIIFKGNLLLHQQSEKSFSLLAIDSERNIEIQINNIQFFENIFHSQIDDTFVSYASLIFINSQSSIVEILNLLSQHNAFTNSSNSFIYINSLNVTFRNYNVQNHNDLTINLLQKYYNLELNEQLESSRLKQLIFEIFNIKNIGGAAKIKTSTFICQYCNFENILAFKSGIFEIITENKGIIKLIEITANNISTDLYQVSNTTGSISINSQNSILNLEISDSSFKNIFNRMSSSILTIQPSNIQNIIVLFNIQIESCISLMNQILYVQFSKKIVEKNKLLFKNIKISQNEEQWKYFFFQIGVLSKNEQLSISSSENSEIYLENCQVSVKNVIFQGFYISPIMIFINSPQLILKNLQLRQIQVFYTFTLIKIIQNMNLPSQVNIQKLRIDSSQIYSAEDNKIEYNNQIYFRIGCNQFSTKLSIDRSSYYLRDVFKSIQQDLSDLTSLISIQSSSDVHQFTFNQLHLIQNNCTFCNDGLFSLNFFSFKYVKIVDFICNYNFVQQYGCIKFITQNNISQIVQMKNLIIIKNEGSQGIALSSFKVPIIIKQCQILFNNASNLGGGLYLELNSSQFIIEKCNIILNKAREGGGIYFNEDSNINVQNFKQNYLIFNQASLYGNNLVENPTHLTLFINSLEMPSIIKNTEQLSIHKLNLQPYITIEQEKKIKSKYLMIPSNQIISEFSICLPKTSQTLIQINKLALMFKNSLNEQLFYLGNSFCLVKNKIVKFDRTEINGYLKKNSLLFDINQNNFDLTQLTFQFDPYNQDYHYLDIQLNCQTEIQQNFIEYNIQAQSYKCQLGEFYVDFGCQKCLPIQGFYSVTYDTIKCSIFDKEKFLEIQQNAINLKKGYWRPNYLSDYSTLCFKNTENCNGSWKVGDKSCNEGHIGALCEECDIYNIMGFGRYFKSQSNSDCFICDGVLDSIIPFILNTIWAILSIIITLKSIERSNELFLLFKIKERFSKILFKLNQDLQSILMKMFLTYLWIFSVIFTFNTSFSFQLNFINQASNTSYSMANNLDCYLSEIQNIELIYFKVIIIIILILWQFTLIFIGYILFSITTKSKFKLSIITNTLLCLYIFNFAGIIKILCSLVSIREISKFQYIQGDLTRLFYSQIHLLWIFYLVLPGLIIFGCAIPFSLFMLMYIKRKSLNQSKLRPHICYLFNEYEQNCYFWEQIKLSKKAIIILFLTYFETSITLKASLIGMTLLLYQQLAFKNRPYIHTNLNKLDLQTGQICSVAIFLAAIQYENETYNYNFSSILLQILIIFLFIMLSYIFIFSIATIYFKKHKFILIKYLHLILKVMKMKKSSQKFYDLLNQKLKQNQKLKENIAKLKKYLMLVSKSQIKHRSIILSSIISVPTHNSRLLSAELTEQHYMITKRMNEF
ncbi:unnamed protein product [Paramecium sonneborni]|uniref:Transmembrane protein n=1 Tax=Paramecium sonneborni TaxID=65129 RepID=A0A8S1NJX6_9CILI|nr:unnamed protein product [Paramecium sonneborni]